MLALFLAFLCLPLHWSSIHVYLCDYSPVLAIGQPHVLQTLLWLPLFGHHSSLASIFFWCLSLWFLTLLCSFLSLLPTLICKFGLTTFVWLSGFPVKEFAYFELYLVSWLFLCVWVSDLPRNVWLIKSYYKCILWRTWILLQNFMASHSIVTESLCSKVSTTWWH